MISIANRIIPTINLKEEDSAYKIIYAIIPWPDKSITYYLSYGDWPLLRNTGGGICHSEILRKYDKTSYFTNVVNSEKDSAGICIGALVKLVLIKNPQNIPMVLAFLTQVPYDSSKFLINTFTNKPSILYPPSNGR